MTSRRRAAPLPNMRHALPTSGAPAAARAHPPWCMQAAPDRRGPGRGLRAAGAAAGQVDNSKLDEALLARVCAACPHLESLAVAGAGAVLTLS